MVNLQEMLWFQELASNWAWQLQKPVFVCESMLRGSFYRCCGNFDVPFRIGLEIPLGRMMRAIRDNKTAAAAMGKDVGTTPNRFCYWISCNRHGWCNANHS